MGRLSIAFTRCPTFTSSAQLIAHYANIRRGFAQHVEPPPPEPKRAPATTRWPVTPQIPSSVAMEPLAIDAAPSPPPEPILIDTERLIRQAQEVHQRVKVRGIPANITAKPLMVVSADLLTRTVAGYYSRSAADLRGPSRLAVDVLPRQVAMYLLRTLTVRSMPQIGRMFGGRDHTTALHGVNKIARVLEHSERLHDDLIAITMRLLDRGATIVPTPEDEQHDAKIRDRDAERARAAQRAQDQDLTQDHGEGAAADDVGADPDDRGSQRRPAAGAVLPAQAQDH